MIPAEILKKKRNSFSLSEKEIQYLINGINTGSISDAQAAAFLTSSCIHGLNEDETKALTFAMRDSGLIFDFSKLKKPIIDKHSTGGVGDKISLLLAPLAISLGIGVPMISGRGLGHTGGTVDKLESIYGFQIRMGNRKLHELMRSFGGFMTSQTHEIAPVDRKLYHLRDITGNVESVGLITSSILSKKMAEGLDGLLMDIKCGQGAFMKDLPQAEELANMMIKVAKKADLKLKVVISNMNQPLGNKIGNWLEVLEAEEALRTGKPDDIIELTKELATEMMLMAFPEKSYNDCYNEVQLKLDSMEAHIKFLEMIEIHGGSIEESKDKYSNYKEYSIISHDDGYVKSINPEEIGLAGIYINAGRISLEDELDYGTGFVLNKKIGDIVSKGDELIKIIYNKEHNLEKAIQMITSAIEISSEKPEPFELIIKKLG